MAEEVHQSIKKENSTFALFDQELAVDSQSLQKSDIVWYQPKLTLWYPIGSERVSRDNFGIG